MRLLRRAHFIASFASDKELIPGKHPRMPPRPETERIHALDALRGLAMFLGIVLHGGMVYTVSALMPGAGSDVSRHWGFDVLIFIVHSFRMQLFFLLAGFFGRLLCERLGTHGFIKQRLKRIGLPFVLAMITVVPMVLFLAMWGFIQQDKPIPEFPGGQSGIPTMHLWFLLYLLYLYGLAVVFRGITVPAVSRIMERALNSPARILIFAPLTAIFLWTGPWWGEPEPPIFGLLPKPMTLAYYGTFFGVGWWLHAHKSLLPRLQINLAITLTLGAVALATTVALAHLKMRPFQNTLALKTLSLLCAATASWSFLFASMGISLRWFSEPQRWGRYMADASYWCYLAHLPIVMALQIATAKLPWPAFLKFALMLAVTMAILLLIYEYRVRYTWVGRLLNGPRERIKLDCEVVPNKEPSPAT